MGRLEVQTEHLFGERELQPLFLCKRKCSVLRYGPKRLSAIGYTSRREEGWKKKISWFAFEEVVVKIKEDQEIKILKSSQEFEKDEKRSLICAIRVSTE